MEVPPCVQDFLAVGCPQGGTSADGGWTVDPRVGAVLGCEHLWGSVCMGVRGTVRVRRPENRPLLLQLRWGVVTQPSGYKSVPKATLLVPYVHLKPSLTALT